MFTRNGPSGGYRVQLAHLRGGISMITPLVRIRNAARCACADAKYRYVSFVAARGSGRRAARARARPHRHLIKIKYLRSTCLKLSIIVRREVASPCGHATRDASTRPRCCYAADSRPRNLDMTRRRNKNNEHPAVGKVAVGGRLGSRRASTTLRGRRSAGRSRRRGAGRGGAAARPAVPVRLPAPLAAPVIPPLAGSGVVRTDSAMRELAAHVAGRARTHSPAHHREPHDSDVIVPLPCYVLSVYT
ncbi:hypothetical protein EVAR_48514_1 [Eumeta japonica]|uniref:Uncharacterized protein n=1 Tax=Eumeta variegata TaxID=151549 RepID=A0A4C1Z653_EUMVA|nr:hypothetical protein EVAR_48514_1 [Eumeta japonica]